MPELYCQAATPSAKFLRMVVTLPDHIPALQRMSEQEVKRELALSLKLTVFQAADLAQMNLFDFQAMLRDRRIPQHYDEADLEQDLAALRELPPR
jgi:predicted HTH domain antitoxin